MPYKDPEERLAYQREWRRKDREKNPGKCRRRDKLERLKYRQRRSTYASDYHKKSSTDLDYRARRIVATARHRSKVADLDFNLTKEWVLERLRVGRCMRTAKRFDLSPGPRKQFAPSADRIDPGRGYTKDNVQIVCWQYNAAKHTFTDADVVRFARAVIDVHEGRLDPTTGIYRETTDAVQEQE